MSTLYREENFFYTTGWSAAMTAVGQTVNSIITIAADASFKAYYITAHVRQGAVGAEVLITNFAGNVQINDAQVGKNFFNVAGPFDALFSNGSLPYTLAPPRTFAANTTIQFDTTSNVVARTEVNYVIHGAKLYAIA